MISLPKQLIYQPRRDIEDYTTGNDLNQALYNALKSIKHPSFFQRMMGVPALSDEDILRIFNDAYYLCIVICNDKRFSKSHFRFSEQVSSKYAWEVALVILSLQRVLNFTAEKHLSLYKPEMEVSLPFCDVLETFKRRKRTFSMSFQLHLPDTYTLEMDWEEATRGFDVDVIMGFLRLWPDINDRLNVCRKMYRVLNNSPRRDMPQLAFSLLYIKRLMKFFQWTIWKDIDQRYIIPPTGTEKKTERKETTQEELLEEEPSSDSVSDAEEHIPVAEPEMKGKSIFVDKLNNEDLSRRKEETERFMKYIRENHLEENILTSKQDNEVCLAFAAFCREWHARGWVPKKPNRGACYRFLCGDCGFRLSVKPRGFQNFIAGMLDDITYDIKDKLNEIKPKVVAMF